MLYFVGGRVAVPAVGFQARQPYREAIQEADQGGAMRVIAQPQRSYPIAGGPIALEDFRRLADRRGARADRLAWILSLPAGLWSAVLGRYRTRWARTALHALDDRMLKDIGISRHEIERVAEDGGPHELMRLRSLAAYR